MRCLSQAGAAEPAAAGAVGGGGTADPATSGKADTSNDLLSSFFADIQATELLTASEPNPAQT